MSPNSHSEEPHAKHAIAPDSPKASGRAVPPSPQEAASRYASLRKLNPANIVVSAGRRWLDGLPPSVRPVIMVEQYPRIVNLVAVSWNDHNEFRSVMADLLIDHRGGRKGFPETILRELRALHNYYKAIPR